MFLKKVEIIDLILTSIHESLLVTCADHVVTVHLPVVQVLEVAFLPRIWVGAEVIVENIDRCFDALAIKLNKITFN